MLKVIEPGKVADTKINPILIDNIETSATIVTDGHSAYKRVKHTFTRHEAVNHQQDEYVRGVYHINSIEGFWSIMKRGIYGNYHDLSPKHLHRYCNEFGYRYNVRKERGAERFEGTIQKAANTRITCNQLIGKAEKSQPILSGLLFFLLTSLIEIATKSLIDPSNLNFGL